MPPVLGAVAAMIMLAGAFSGPAALLASAGPGALSALLQLAVLAPLALFAARGRPGAGRALLVAAGFLLISYTVHLLPRIGVFAGLDWNWQGKTFELIWQALLFFVLLRWAREEAGLRWHERGSLCPALQVIIGVFLVSAALVFWGSATGDESFGGSLSTERLFFDLAHPNLVEELLWRGILLALLDRALGTPWRFFGARVGWGLVLTSLSFGLGHGLLIETDGLLFAPEQILLTGAMGLLLGWVRARTGSVWLAYLGHCAPELGIHAGVAASALVR